MRRGLEALGDPEIPEGMPHESFGVTSFWVEPMCTLTQKFKVTDGAANGEITIKAEVHSMACTPEFCDPPALDPVTATLTVSGAKGRGRRCWKQR